MMTRTSTKQILDAISAGLAVGAANDDWDAPEMQIARDLTAQAGLVWDFSTWSHAAKSIEEGRLVA